MTLSRGSLPRLQAGRWIIFATCDDFMYPCPSTQLEVESWGEANLHLRLTTGVLVVVLGTLLVLFVVNTNILVGHTTFSTSAALT